MSSAETGTTYVLHFTGPINSSTTGQLIDKCTKAVQQEAGKLVIKIATMGGDCSYGFALFNFLRSLPIPLHTHNLGTVESMGNIIFLAGEHRTASRFSKFLFHPFHWTLHGAIDHARMREYSMSMDEDRFLYEQIVLERTQGAAEPMDVGTYLLASPRFISPDEALKCGLIHAIDEVLMPKGTMNTSVHA